MHLYAGFSPPRPALEQLSAALASTRRVTETEPAKSRWFDRRRSATTATADAPWGLEPVPVDGLRVPIAGFGNVTPADADRVVQALTSAARNWPRPTLVLAGASAFDSPTDRSLWAPLDGEVDALIGIAREVSRCVERLGFFVDRRAFHPMLEIATTAAGADPSDLDAAVEALASYRGEPWVLESLTAYTTSFVGTETVWREFERIPLAATR